MYTKIPVRRHLREGRLVRWHYRTIKKKVDLRKAYEFAQNVKEVYDLISDTPNFINGSKKEKLEIVLNTALSMGIPHSTAIQIAYKLLQKNIK